MTNSSELSRIEREISPEMKIDFYANQDKIRRIIELRDQKNVLILGHNYMHPLVYQLSDHSSRGDSLALSKYAAQTDKPIILFDGVRFMAETAKILSPDKKVLIADPSAGCSLADPFTGEDVRDYRRRFPGIPVVTYINSYADVKAEVDYCCTSANGPDVVKHAAKEFGTDRVVFLPDTLMGENIQKEFDRDKVGIDVIYPGKYDNERGACEVHEQFTPEMLKMIRKQHEIPKGGKDRAILVHWECRPEVLDEADFYGSTSEMGKYIRDHPGLEKVWLGTECEMSANLAAEFPNVDFVKSCAVYCPHMRKITLDGILNSLENDVYEINVDPEIASRARKSIERMLAIGRRK